MKEITISALLLITIFLVGARTEIQFNPFKITFLTLTSGIGWTLMVIALNLVLISERKKSYKEGFSDSTKQTIEIIEELRK